jgi:hypothetical protein
MITITITTGGETLERHVDPDAITLGFLEDIEKAQDSGKWRDLIPAIGTLLGLTREQTRDVSVAQFRDIASAIQQAGTVPNASASPSE